MQPLLHPVARGFVKSEFVDYIRKDLSKHYILKVLYCFPVVKVQGVQTQVVILNSANGHELSREQVEEHVIP